MLRLKGQFVSVIVVLTMVGLLLGSTPISYAATCTSAASGSWGTATTWVAPCNKVGGPIATDTVIIASNHIVTMTVSSTVASVNININGQLSLMNSGTTITTMGDLTNQGILDAGVGTIINVGGNLTTATGGIFTAGASTLVDVGQALTIDGTATTADTILKIGKGLLIKGTYTAGSSNITLEEDFTISGGTFTAGASITTVKGSFTNTGGTFTANASTHNIAGNLTTNGNGTITAGSAIFNVIGNVTTDSSVFTAGSAVFNIKGNWLLNAGSTFTPGSSIVNLNGTGAQLIGGSIPTTFNVLNISNGSHTVSFGNNITLTAASFWVGGGSCETLLILDGGNHLVADAGKLVANWVDVKNSSLGGAVAATNGRDSGGNTNWSFTHLCPSSEATNTPIPGATNTATSTATPVPGATNTAVVTNTTVPVAATNTSVPVVATNTSVPVAATNTSVPVAATNTSVPVVATNTSVPVAATNTPAPGATSVPVATNTPVPVATNTPVPVATNTSVPIATNTPVPVATNTPVPVAGNISTSTGSGTANFRVNNGLLEELVAVTTNNAATACGGSLPVGHTFPHGFFDFNVTGIGTGGATQVTITLPQALSATAKYFMCNSSQQWVEVPFTTNGMQYTLQVADGLDGLVDGTFTDPGGFGNKTLQVVYLPLIMRQ